MKVKVIKTYLPTVVMILFGLAIGVMLIIDAEKLTEFAFRLFGAALLVAALIMVIRFLSARKSNEATSMILFTAIISFILGMVLVIGARMIVEASTTLCAIFYGAVMVVNGVLKISHYISLKKQHVKASGFLVFSGILSVALGVVALVFSAQALKIIGLMIGVTLIVNSILDIISMVLGRRQDRILDIYDTSGDDSDYDLE